jgi:molecular chaperone HtpG
LENNLLIIEDNGIGMNQKIFENYFLQIGKSYYSSPLFYSKFSDIDVTSEFGIGILSVFMIASSFHVESRREPENPLQPFESINFEIPAAQSYIVQKNGNKLEIGTRITLKLKESNPFKKNNLRSILEEILPTPAFTINISQNNINETYSGKQIHQIEEINFENLEVPKFLKAHRITDYNWDNKFTHSLLKVKFDTADDFQLKDILGELLIVNANSLNYYSTFNGILCQRSFSVGFPETSENKFFIKPTESIQGLFPKWLSYFSSLNFTNKACLAITPDRCDFTIDEKYKILKSKIEKRIIDELDNHLTIFNNKNGATNTEKYIDFLYISGFFGFDLDEYEMKI